MATTRLCLITRSSRVLAHELRRLTRQSTRSIQSIEDYLVQLVRWAPSNLLRERLIMKKFATVLAAGALALGAGLFVLVETTDLANAASRGGGGGRSFSGGGGRSFSGGGGRSFSGGGGRAVSARHVSPTRSSVGARRVGTTKHVNVGRTNTARRGNVGKGSSVKHVNIGNTRTNKHVNIGNTKNTGKHVNIGGVGPGGLKAGPGGLQHWP